jgi:hypothetical protein
MDCGSAVGRRPPYLATWPSERAAAAVDVEAVAPAREIER